MLYPTEMSAERSILDDEIGYAEARSFGEAGWVVVHDNPHPDRWAVVKPHLYLAVSNESFTVKWN